jgi:DNA polymerase III gamma/tau subunit
LSRLEQFRGSGALTSDAITALVGRPAEQQLIDLLGHIAGRDTAAVLGAAQELVAAGCDLSVTLESMAHLLRVVLYARELGAVPSSLGASTRMQEAALEYAQVFDLDRMYQLLAGVDGARQQMIRGISPELAFEFALLSGLVDTAAPQTATPPPAAKPSPAPKSAPAAKPHVEAKPAPAPQTQPSADEPAAPQHDSTPMQPCVLTAAQLCAAFPAVRLSLRSAAADLYLQIITSKATADDGTVTVHVPAELSSEHESDLKRLLSRFGDHDIRVVVTTPPQPAPELPQEHPPAIESGEVAERGEETPDRTVDDVPPATDDDLDALLLGEGAVLDD